MLMPFGINLNRDGLTAPPLLHPRTNVHGGYYGLDVVTPPRPQTFVCERDNLKNSERTASILIFYM